MQIDSEHVTHFAGESRCVSKKGKGPERTRERGAGPQTPIIFKKTWGEKPHPDLTKGLLEQKIGDGS